jgi:hypothetical protein
MSVSSPKEWDWLPTGNALSANWKISSQPPIASLVISLDSRLMGKR